MTTPAGRRAVSPPAPEGKRLRCACLSPDGRRLAYVRDEGADPDAGGSGVFLCDPATGWNRRLAGHDARVDDLAFSADGALVAYTVGGLLTPAAARVVAWALTSAPGEVGRAPATAFAWSPGKPALFLADTTERALVRYDLATGKRRKLAELDDDALAGFPPRLAVAAEAKRIAFTVHHAARDLTEVWVLSRDGEEATASLLTQVPGADIHVHPFWSPGGGSLGLAIVHPGFLRSAIILVPRLQGEGEIYHEAERVDAPVSPAWSPSSRVIAFFAADDEGHQRLSLLDCASRTVEPILDAGEAAGCAPRFIDAHHLAVEGGAAALVLSFNDPL